MAAQEKPRLILPQDSWERIYFGSEKDGQTIRGRAKLSKLADPRSYVLPPGDIEIRLWIGFGLSYLQGYVLRKTGDQWAATFLLPALPRFAQQDYKLPLPAPKSGWSKFWNALLHDQILTLPDDSTLKNDRPGYLIMDGVGYVVEINKDGIYRTYLYSNPEDHSWPEAKRIRSIVSRFRRELPTPDYSRVR